MRRILGLIVVTALIFGNEARGWHGPPAALRRTPTAEELTDPPRMYAAPFARPYPVGYLIAWCGIHPSAITLPGCTMVDSGFVMVSTHAKTTVDVGYRCRGAPGADDYLPCFLSVALEIE